MILVQKAITINVAAEFAIKMRKAEVNKVIRKLMLRFSIVFSLQRYVMAGK